MKTFRLILAAALGAGPLGAQALSSAQYLVSSDVTVDTTSGAMDASNRYQLVPGTVSASATTAPSAPSQGGGTTSATLVATPSQLLSATATATGTFNSQAFLHDYNQASSTATLSYDFLVSGSTPKVLVSAAWLLSIHVGAAAPGDYSNSAAGASLLLYQGSDSPLINDGLSHYNSDTAYVQTENGSATLLLDTGVVYSVKLTATATVSIRGNVGGVTGGGGTETNSALADPTFSIASNVANPGDYSLTFSPGIGNAAPVPEPQRWALMLAGVFGIAGVLRGRRGAGAS